MPTLSVGQVLAYGRKYGFTDSELPDLYAVTTTESGNRTDARQPGGLGRGIVQIDLGEHPHVTEAEAMDPDFAFGFARQLSRNAAGLGAPNWYGPRDRPKAAEQARSEARKLLQFEKDSGSKTILTDPAGVARDVAGDVASGVAGAAENAVAAALRSLFPPEFVRRVLMLLAGAGLVVVGAAALGFDVLAGPAKTAGKVARKVAR